MEQLFSFLNNVRPLSTELSNHLASIVRTRSIARKEFLIWRGQIDRNICFISSGMLRGFYMKEDIEVSCSFMKEGDICLSIENFHKYQKGYEYIQAIEDTVISYINYKELENIYNDFPEFNVIVRIITFKYLKHLAKLLYAIRMHSAAERYKWILLYQPELLLRIPQKYIASYLGITPETLSKIRRKKKND